MHPQKGIEIVKAGLCLLCMVILTACSPRRDLAPDSAEGNQFYLPPTSLPTAIPLVPTNTESTLIPLALPTPSGQGETCLDSLRFLQDLTIPDGTEVSPGQKLDKRWKVENNGTCNWNEKYRIKLIAGSDLGALSEQALYPARSGTQPSIRILYTAPDKPGHYRSAWQAYSPQGMSFGDPFFIEIVVPEITPTAGP